MSSPDERFDDAYWREIADARAVNTCRACPDGCRECAREQEICECYTHAEETAEET